MRFTDASRGLVKTRARIQKDSKRNQLANEVGRGWWEAERSSDFVFPVNKNTGCLGRQDVLWWVKRLSDVKSLWYSTSCTKMIALW